MGGELSNMGLAAVGIEGLSTAGITSGIGVFCQVIGGIVIGSLPFLGVVAGIVQAPSSIIHGLVRRVRK